MGSEGGPSELGGSMLGDDDMLDFTDSEEERQEEERREVLHPTKQYRGARVKELKRQEREEKRKDFLHPSTVGNVC